MKYKGNINLMLQQGESAVVPKGEMWRLTLYARGADKEVTAIIGTEKGVTEVDMSLGLPVSINLGSGAKLGTNAYGTRMFFCPRCGFYRRLRRSKCIKSYKVAAKYFGSHKTEI